MRVRLYPDLRLFPFLRLVFDSSVVFVREHVVHQIRRRLSPMLEFLRATIMAEPRRYSVAKVTFERRPVALVTVSMVTFGARMAVALTTVALAFLGALVRRRRFATALFLQMLLVVQFVDICKKRRSRS